MRSNGRTIGILRPPAARCQQFYLIISQIAPPGGMAETTGRQPASGSLLGPQSPQLRQGLVVRSQQPNRTGSRSPSRSPENQPGGRGERGTTGGEWG
jgi:hypothetical protein